MDGLVSVKSCHIMLVSVGAVTSVLLTCSRKIPIYVILTENGNFFCKSARHSLRFGYIVKSFEQLTLHSSVACCATSEYN